MNDVLEELRTADCVWTHRIQTDKTTITSEFYPKGTIIITSERKIKVKRFWHDNYHVGRVHFILVECKKDKDQFRELIEKLIGSFYPKLFDDCYQGLERGLGSVKTKRYNFPIKSHSRFYSLHADNEEEACCIS